MTADDSPTEDEIDQAYESALESTVQGLKHISPGMWSAIESLIQLTLSRPLRHLEFDRLADDLDRLFEDSEDTSNNVHGLVLLSLLDASTGFYHETGFDDESAKYIAQLRHRFGIPLAELSAANFYGPSDWRQITITHLLDLKLDEANVQLEIVRRDREVDTYQMRLFSFRNFVVRLNQIFADLPEAYWQRLSVAELRDLVESLQSLSSASQRHIELLEAQADEHS
jgi:hypothetical protein